jgi:ribosomal protein L40E
MSAKKFAGKRGPKKPKKTAAAARPSKKTTPGSSTLYSKTSSVKKLNVCRECGRLNAMSYNFCEKCGGEVVAVDCPVCPNCSSVNAPGAKKCLYCGEKIKAGGANKASAIAAPAEGAPTGTKQEIQAGYTEPFVNLDAGAIVSDAIGIFSENFIFFITLGLTGGLMGILARVHKMSNLPETWVDVGLYFIEFFITAFCSVMIYLAMDRIEKGEKPGFGAFWAIFDEAADKYMVYLVTMLLYTLIIIGGLLLLVVPGLIFIYKYKLAGPMSVLDTKSGEDYFKKSSDATAGYKWDIFFCALLSGLATIPLYIAVAAAVSIIALVLGAGVHSQVLDVTGCVCIPLITPYGVMITYLIYRRFRKLP